MEYKYQQVFCSSCGQGFGPGNEGFALCRDHAADVVVPSFNFTFCWEIDEIEVNIGVDYVWDDYGNFDVECTICNPYGALWPEIEGRVSSWQWADIVAEAKRLIREDCERSAGFDE